MTAKHIKTEFIGGLTTFFTMAYIIIVNPSILSTPGTGMSFSGVLTATVLLSFLMTLLMGLYGKLPFAVAPGMGINAFFTFSLILGQQIPWPTALGMVFWAGVFFLLISATPLRESIAKAIPVQLRAASATGIGLFLTFIGLKNAGLVAADPATFVKFGGLGYGALSAIAGLLIMIFLMRRKNPLAILAGIFAVTATALALGKIPAPEVLLSSPDFSTVFALDITGALKLSLLPAILSIMFTDLFDSISTFVGVSQASGMKDEHGEPLRLKQGLIVDSIATFGAGLLGTSSGTAYIESAAGIEAGGRTGLASVFTAICFLPCLFLAPLVGLVPAYATAPALILVGCLMFKTVGELKFEKLEEIFPAFITIVLIPLTFSITQGLLWGFLAHTALFVLAGRAREISKMLYVISGICLLMLWL